jgi:uncharacterized protein
MDLTHDRVRELFAHLEAGDGERFFAAVADDVNWTIEGVQPVAGTYTSKSAFIEGAIARLGAIFQASPRFEVQHVFVDGDTAIVEMRTVSTVDLRGVPFESPYCWVCRFGDDKIVEARAYLDSATVAYFLSANDVRRRT